MTALRLDLDILARAGFSKLSEDQARRVLRDLYDTLEIRVGRRLAGKLTEAQLATFERLTSDEGADRASAQVWLNRNLPDYQAEVSEQLTYIEERLRQAAEGKSRPMDSETKEQITGSVEGRSPRSATF